MAATAIMVPRKYLFPCTGYVSSRRKALIDPHQISADSRDVLISPNEGQLLRRLGMSYLGESDIAAPVGQMEATWTSASARARKAFVFPSSSGWGNPAALVGGSGVAAFGTMFVYDLFAGTRYNYGKEFGSTHYPTSDNAGGCNFKMVPLPYVTPDDAAVTSTSVGLTRCAHAYARRFVNPGSRGVHCGDHTFSPSLYGTPSDWNNKYNTSTGSGSQVNRMKPWGLYPPAFPPTVGAATASTGTADANWQDGDTYYLSVMFQDENGAFSKPFTNRPPDTGLSAAKCGLVTVGTVGGSSTYKSVPYTNIIKGPPGTRARVLLRTAKVRRTTGTDSPILPSLTPLFIIAVIENNAQTSFTDYFGSDADLRRDDLAVRYDGIWPPASRNVFEFERRLAVGYSRKNPCAIIMFPTGSAVTRDLNVADDDAAAYGTIAMAYRIVLTGTKAAGNVADLQWRRVVLATGVVSTGTYAIGGSTTLQGICDYINQNASDPAATGGEWAAQLVPGTDGNIPGNNLQPTCIILAGCTTVSGSPIVTGAAGLFADLAIGMGVRGTGIPANTIVIAKSTSTLNGDITLGTKAGVSVNATASSGGSPVTLTFHVDTGDDSIVGDSTFGNVRCYCPSFPGVIPFRGSYLDTLPVDQRSIYFTAAPPGQAASATSSFFNSLSNRQGVPTRAGAFLAGAPIGKRAVLAYTNGIYVLDNQRGGTTGDDIDFHPYVGNIARGCTAINSVVAGNGWVGYLTRDGYIVADVEGDTLRERLLSGDLFDPSQSTVATRGTLAATVNDSIRYPQPDAVPFQEISTVIYVTLSQGALNLFCADGVSGPPIRLVYDYRASIEASGLDQVLRSVGGSELGAQAYGWSPPQKQPFTALVGPVYNNVEVGFVEYLNNASIPTPSTADLTLVQLDAHIGRDDIFYQAIASNLAISSNLLTAQFPGSYRSVAVGARVVGTNIQAGTTVITKSATGDTITLSLATTNVATVTGRSLTFTGREVEGIAYFAMDQVESLRQKKAGHRATVLYRCQSGEQLYVGYARDRDRTSRRTMLLPATAGDSGDEVVENPMPARTPGEVCEWSIETHNGTLGAALGSGGYPAEFWGAEAEIELLDSPV